MKKFLPLLVIIAAITGIALFARTKISAAGPAEKTQYKTEKVQIGTVRKTVSATGVLQPWKVVDIKSKAGGRVDSLKVDVGDVVKKGRELALIDPSDTQLQVDQAQADIDAAAAKQTQSSDTYNLQIQQSLLSVEQAKISLSAVKANLAAAIARRENAKKLFEAQPHLTDASIASARANVDNAEKQLNELREATQLQDRAAAQSAMDQAQANTANAKANLTRQKSLLDKGFVSQQVVDQAQATYDVARAQLTSAQRKMDTIDKEQQAAELALRARIAQARAQLESASASEVDKETRRIAYDENVALVQQLREQVKNAEKQLLLAKANIANNQIRKSDIAQAQAQKARAMASYTNAKKTLEQTVVRAPSDGVILQKYVEEGTIITSGLSFNSTGTSIVQLGDITRMYVDVTVDETDIANVHKDQEVDVTVEAFPGRLFKGVVSRVDPQAKLDQNVTTIHVRVEISNTEEGFSALKPAMNATCEFVLAKKPNVLMVPNEALRTEGKSTYVEIAVGGKPAPIDPKSKATVDPALLVDVNPKKTEVVIGQEGNDTVEIKSGLKEGDIVVTQKIDPTPQRAGSPFGGGGNNRPGGFRPTGGGGGGRPGGGGR